MRILIVDDAKTFHDLAKVVIEQEFPKARFDTVEDASNCRMMLERNPYNVVLTDVSHLGSQEDDLLEFIHDKYPELPVLLMSAIGLEDRVLDAIRRGAVGYISKERFHDELPLRIRSILNASPNSEANSLSSKLLKEQTSKFSLPNDRNLINKVNNYVAQLLQIFNICQPREQMRAQVAFEEALVNAMYHGNLEISSELRGVDDEAYMRMIEQRQQSSKFGGRRVDVTISVTATMAKLTIRDQGKGFDVSTLPDPLDPDNVIRAHGRGVFLMKSFMDEVHYNKTGNEVTLIKYKTDHSQSTTDSSIWTHVQNQEIMQLRAQFNE